ncbi:MAG TPA: dockerin type I repeat-containing protein [Candidatus Acidoferrum sp.]|nr:dockerin type I repeat-containing protein [Candidatus Acidoferrum sp.]
MFYIICIIQFCGTSVSSNSAMLRNGNMTRIPNPERFRSVTTHRRLDQIRALEIASLTDVEMSVGDSLGRITGYDSLLQVMRQEIPNTGYEKENLGPDSTEADTMPLNEIESTQTVTTLALGSPIQPLYQIDLYSNDSGGFKIDARVVSTGIPFPPPAVAAGSLMPGQSKRIWIAPVDDHTPAGIIFKLGDVDTMGAVDIGDLEALVAFLYTGVPSPQPVVAAADVNCDGTVDVSDIQYLVDYLFTTGPAPQCPY